MAPRWMNPSTAAKQEKARQRSLMYQLTRNYSLPLDGLDEATQHQVQQARLKRLLHKFWGLMTEAGRPWHYDTVIHLCCRLPKPARQHYRRLKPSTMQRMIANRMMVERELRAAAHDASKLMSTIKHLQRQVLEQQEVINMARLQLLAQNALKLKAAAYASLSRLRRLQDQAKKLHDGDYAEYAELMVPAFEELGSLCDECRRVHIAYLGAMSDMNLTGAKPRNAKQSNSSSGAQTRQQGVTATHIGHAPKVLFPKQQQGLQWRYPPASYITSNSRFARPLPDAFVRQSAAVGHSQHAAGMQRVVSMA
eukprot:CAMPEP_0202899258 /NCGR_PEP_ID=MMETSP1392-20130828/7543_1 /ASSEMBLY_ACC=CAM_ASM_000868 /TAXON_ID=225041 /ORGANISM="Chlamydomonas chlamydogama, Strain SAG 11-48b" /LENGTH=307 /DNA_ID=CAMNT_0049585391 /DNA_START=173 /DNA_END=1096 /DNA_ORIENTATION=+